MPSWNDILQELQKTEASIEQPLDTIRRRYLRQLHERTGRNVIAYYSAFLTNATKMRVEPAYITFQHMIRSLSAKVVLSLND